MTISAVSGAASTPQARPMGMEDFLKILLTQLINQDPLKPMDSQQFMAQMAQFTSLEQTEQMNEKMSTLVANQAALQSVGLIGRTVDISTPTGPLTGRVTSLSLAADAPSMTVTSASGSRIDGVSLSQINAVR